MAELRRLAGPEGSGAHVIFFHGLNGTINKTWNVDGSEVLWPAWLIDEIDNLTVWAAEYSAAGTRWQGPENLVVTELANVLLQRFAHEPELEAGNVAFVGYSLGGIVAKAVLRAAEDAKTDRYAQSLFNRVERIATIATPHLGARAAGWSKALAVVVRPTKLAQSLRTNEPILMDLNRWFKSWAALRPERTLVFCETLNYAAGHQIVGPESGNPGTVREIPVDAHHGDIVRVKDRGNLLYLGLRRFLQEMTASRLKVAPALANKAAPRNDGLSLAPDEKKIAAPLKADPAPQIYDDAIGALAVPAPPSELVDAEIGRRLARLRRGRFVENFPRASEARALIEALLRGQLSSGGSAARAAALAWCARILAQSETIDWAKEALAEAERLDRSQLTAIARAFLVGLSDREAALRIAAQESGPVARSAMLFIVARETDPSDALDWFNKSGLLPADLDPDGKILLLSLYLQTQRWEDARDLSGEARSLALDAPQFLKLAAHARLVWVLPSEIRDVHAAVPLNPRTLPMASDDAAMADRRQAIELFGAYRAAIADLGCTASGELAEDLALWLRLRDPSLAAVALVELQESTRDSQLTIRRFTLLLDYGVEMDLELVERAIDREETLSAGESVPAAVARYAYAFTRDGPAAAAAYIRRHWDQLARHLSIGALSATEIELLARAGLTDEAAARLSAIPEDALSSEERARVAAVVSHGKDAGNDIQAARDRFAAEQSLPALLGLLEAQIHARDWAGARDSARDLFERTRDLNALVKLVRALAELSDSASIFEVLQNNSDLVAQSPELQMHWAWSLYRAGDLEGARAALSALPADAQNTTALQVNLAIASGRWNDLHAIVESAFERRGELSAERLMQAAQLAKNLGSDRAWPLTVAAVDKGDDDPRLLTAAYGFAVATGRDHEPIVRSWFEKAVELSGEDGPLQRFSLDELVQRQPDWQAHQTEVVEKISNGALPLFLGARALNRSLTEMVLVAGLSNIAEVDPRRRSLIPLRSGIERTCPPVEGRIALDPTAILTLLLAGVFKETVKALGTIVLPHDTMMWLFEERQKLPFHQPSRVQDAQRIQDLIASGMLAIVTPEATPPRGLPAEVGLELAQLLADAKAQGGLVIRGGPIHRPGSLGKETGKLEGFEASFRSGLDLIESLRVRGTLTAEEHKAAASFFARQESGEWPQHDIVAGSTLFIDGLTLGYLNQFDLLGKLSQAGHKLLVHASAVEEHMALIEHSRRANEVDGLIAEAREVFEAGLKDGSVRLGSSFRLLEDDDDDAASSPLNHPTRQLFELGDGADLIVADDRAMNRYASVDGLGGSSALVSSFELMNGLVASGKLKEQLLRRALTRLRRANVVFLPVELNELLDLLAEATQIEEHVLVETLELRAIRENIQSAALSRLLQMPSEADWLVHLMRSLRQAIQAQWTDEVSDELAAARSEWLLNLHDMRTWSHRLPGEFDEERAMDVFVQPLLLAITRFDVDDAVQDRFGQWVDKRVLQPLRETEPKLYRRLVEAAGRLVEKRYEDVAADVD